MRISRSAASRRSRGDDVGLDRDGALDELAQPSRRASPGRRAALGVGLDQLEDPRVGDEAALDDLGQPGDEVVARQRRQRGRGRTARPRGGRNAPTRFLPSAVLIPVLPPTAASTIAEQRRRDLHDAHAAQPGRRDEPGEVGGRSAADADDGVGAGEAGLAEHPPQARRRPASVLASSRPGSRRPAPRRRPPARTRATARPARRASAGGTTQHPAHRRSPSRPGSSPSRCRDRPRRRTPRRSPPTGDPGRRRHASAAVRSRPREPAPARPPRRPPPACGPPCRPGASRPLVDGPPRAPSARDHCARGLHQRAAAATWSNPIRVAASAMPTSRKTHHVLGQSQLPRRRVERPHPPPSDSDAVVLGEGRAPPPRARARGSAASPSLDEDVGDRLARPSASTIAASVSRNGDARAARRAPARTVDLPDARRRRPTTTTRCGHRAGSPRAQARRGSPRGRRRGCARLGHASRRRTSPARVGEDQRDHRLGDDAGRRARRTRRSAGVIALAGSPVATSTVSSARGTVEIGFIAARTRRTLAGASCRPRCRRRGRCGAA